MTLILGRTLVAQAKEVHLIHVQADGGSGHTAADEWRNCQETTCAAFRASVSGPKTFRVVQQGEQK